MILVIFSFDLLNLLPIRSLHLLHDSYMYTIFLICHFITVERAVFGMLLLSEARGVQRENMLLFMPIPKFAKVFHVIDLHLTSALKYKRVWENLVSRVFIKIIETQFSLIKLNSYFQSANVRRRFVIIATVLRLFG